MAFLICYDISDEKRLVKVHRLLSKACLQVQKSVFICQERKLKDFLMEQLFKLIKLNTDSLQCYEILHHVQPQVIII